MDTHESAKILPFVRRSDYLSPFEKNLRARYAAEPLSLSSESIFLKRLAETLFDLLAVKGNS